MTIALRFDTCLVWLNEHPCGYAVGGQINVEPLEAIWNFSPLSLPAEKYTIFSEKGILNVGRELGETAKKDEKLSM